MLRAPRRPPPEPVLPKKYKWLQVMGLGAFASFLAKGLACRGEGSAHPLVR